MLQNHQLFRDIVVDNDFDRLSNVAPEVVATGDDFLQLMTQGFVSRLTDPTHGRDTQQPQVDVDSIDDQYTQLLLGKQLGADWSVRDDDGAPVTVAELQSQLL